MVFSTERLVFRKLKWEDHQDFFDIMGNPKVMDPIPQKIFSREKSDEKLKELIQCYEASNPRIKVFATVMKDTNEFIGFGGWLTNDEGVEEVAYRIKEKFWGVGYGSEMAKGVLTQGFEVLKLDKMAADVNISNAPSIKILDKFLYPIREFYNENDQCYDRRYELKKEDWLQVKYANQVSERLYFRKLTEEDISIWRTFFDNNSNLSWLGLDLTKTKDELAQLWIQYQIKRYKEKCWGQLALIDKKSRTFIGLAGILPREIDGRSEFEITYSLLPAYWSQGYASEAARKLIDFAFSHQVSNRLISFIHKDNNGSVRIAEKNGMHYDRDFIFNEMPVGIYKISR